MHRRTRLAGLSGDTANKVHEQCPYFWGLGVLGFFMHPAGCKMDGFFLYSRKIPKGMNPQRQLMVYL